jgi:hypothetical protein
MSISHIWSFSTGSLRVGMSINASQDLPLDAPATIFSEVTRNLETVVIPALNARLSPSGGDSSAGSTIDHSVEYYDATTSIIVHAILTVCQPGLEEELEPALKHLDEQGDDVLNLVSQLALQEQDRRHRAREAEYSELEQSYLARQAEHERLNRLHRGERIDPVDLPRKYGLAPHESWFRRLFNRLLNAGRYNES